MANGPASEYLPVPISTAAKINDTQETPSRIEYQLLFRRLFPGVIFPELFMIPSVAVVILSVTCVTYQDSVNNSTDGLRNQAVNDIFL